MVFSSGGGSDLEYAFARRQSGILSWLQFRNGTTVRELADLYAEGLRGRNETASRKLTALAISELAVLRAVQRTTIVLPSRRGVSYIALTEGGRAEQVRDSMPSPEFTPRERAFIGLLRNGMPLSEQELDGGIPFAVFEDHEINEPWRTQACLGHLVALGQIRQSEDGCYQLSADGIAAN